MTRKILSDELLIELRHFETFFKKIGFKSIEGSIYGLLVLANEPLSPEDIRAELSLSQSAVSNALKTLKFYNSIVTSEDRIRGCRTYAASEDCLSIVVNVFRKRETNFIRDYRQMAERALLVSRKEGLDDENVRVKRLTSIAKTCEFGESIIKFVYSLDELGFNKHFVHIAEKMPLLFDLILEGPEKVAGASNMIKGLVGNKVKTYMNKFIGESDAR